LLCRYNLLARAAHFGTFGFGGVDVVQSLEEGREGLLFRGGVFGIGQRHGETNVLSLARAAFLLVLDVACGLLALQLTFGTRASGGFGARPRARGLFAQRGTVGFGGNTSGVALSRGANGFTLGAVSFFTQVLGASDRAFGLLAVNSAFGAFGLLALHFAFGASADGVADGRASGVVALPSALRVAVSLLLGFQAFAFGHVKNPDLFGSNAAGTVQLHKEGESSVLSYSGDFETADLVVWVVSEGFPLVDELSQDSWSRAQSSGTDLVAIFQTTKETEDALEVAKAYKGNLVVTISDQVSLAARWGSSGNVVPTAIYVSNKDGQVTFTIWNEDSGTTVNADTLKKFVDGSRDGSYESYIKSEPIPESNDGPVTVLVGKTFEEIVKANKNVFVEFYAPWCGHCKKLAPVLDELGTYYKDDSDVVIAKVDATANGNPKGVSVQGFPTLIFWDANNVQTTYNGERDLESFKAWIETHRTTLAAGEKVDL